jgi:UDPglucose 6-dehydrogenase
VPVGTHKRIQRLINSRELHNKNIKVVSNPEFLREGSALHDTFNGSRIVIGSNDKDAANIIEEVNRPFGISIFHTDPNSAEMIKYASNAFLATKISFINEIANICEKINANIDDVAHGMGLDNRIGTHFLNAGIGYGGSCFPKDTKALTKIAENIDLEFNLLKSVIEVNVKQQNKLFELALTRLKSLRNKKIAILGLAFKPNTDDVREAASIVIIKKLIENGAEVVAYDPIANENAKLFLPKNVKYANNIEETLKETDLVCILTEWEEIKRFDLSKYSSLMKTAIILDGRNCYSIDEVKKHRIEYYSIGRPMISFDT